MKRSDVIAAARKAGLSAEHVRKLGAELPEDDKPEDAVEEDDKSAQTDDPAEGEEGDAEAETDDEGEGQADAKVSASAARSILALPEAKGRSALAQELAFTPGMTAARAKTLLSSAPKGTNLSERMEGRDPKVSGGGGKSALSADDRLIALAREKAAARKARG